MRYFGTALLLLLALALVIGGNHVVTEKSHRQVQRGNAEAQVQRIAEDLDQRTTETGVYLRVDEDDIQEIDPWGTPVRVSYSQGGVAEVVTVRSAGPDGKFHSDDDVVAECMVANLKGIGEGVKKNIEETTANAAKGAVKGTAAGIKEVVRESMPFKKKKVAEEKSETEQVEANAQPAIGVAGG